MRGPGVVCVQFIRFYLVSSPPSLPCRLRWARLLGQLHAHTLASGSKAGAALIAVLLGTAFWVLSAIAPVHAINQRQETPVTELFAHACDTVSAVFLVLVLCELNGVNNLEVQWYVVQLGQLAFMRKHIRAFAASEPVKHGVFTGPGGKLSTMFMDKYAW